MTVIHCSAPCIHVENGCCKKRDVIIKYYYPGDMEPGQSEEDIVVYCCHFEEVKDGDVR